MRYKKIGHELDGTAKDAKHRKNERVPEENDGKSELMELRRYFRGPFTVLLRKK